MKTRAAIPAARQKSIEPARDRALPAKMSEQQIHEAEIQLVRVNSADRCPCQIGR